MLLVGTMNGLWEIGTTPKRRLVYVQQHLRRVLENKAIAALVGLSDGGAIAAINDGKFWRHEPGQRWRRYAIGEAAVGGERNVALTTTLAVGIDARLWRGTAPVGLWHTSLADHAARTWQLCAALDMQPEARQWWGPCDPAAPLLTAIAPDPRDARVTTIAVAVGGIYHTSDNGQTWQGQHRGIAPLVRREARDYDAHRNVLSLARHPSFPDVLYATTESALYRADTACDTWAWQDITPEHARGMLDLPGRIAPVTHERDGAYAILPLVDDDTHCTLWQTRDAGNSWQAYDGAPVLPISMSVATGSAPSPIMIAVSRVGPEGIALVTPSGDVYLAETLDMDAWRHIATGLGDVTCAVWAER